MQFQYIIKRIIFAVITVFVLITITFLLMHILPGDPFTGEQALPEATMNAINMKYGLDKPMWTQFLVYISNILGGDLGTSLTTNRQVTDIISQAFPVSLELGVRALVFALIMGLLLGIIAAVKHDTAWDTVSMLVSMIGVSVPSFIIGSVLQYYLGLKLYQATNIRFFSVMGWANESSKFLPALALAISAMATVSRLMRASMLEVLEQDYIKTARAKGLNNRAVIWSHCLRNAILPVITILGPLIATLLTGTFVIENIFSIPGLGKYFVESILTNDYPVIIGTTMFFGSVLVLISLAVDLIYGLIDPRIKLKGEA